MSTLDLNLDQIRVQLASITRRLFDRKLLDMAGGNISVRLCDIIIISPRYAGSQKHWQLEPGDFVEGSIQSEDT